ncbi:hypothetical protein [Sphingomonas sp. PP-CE-1G-424]|uniref:hypothetical protein n=1 Tax=Sphingomonas sp. PP-CE-1G-424 TaxID=2135658 RepID=UPI001054491F|nr:hypothetical protein [Sphingomonas sp. PP-CE-1G-424]TCP65361.1 hypothetical protein C8J43_11217 [Sphingomonas sp. PP-CE-1G-424]
MTDARTTNDTVTSVPPLFEAPADGNPMASKNDAAPEPPRAKRRWKRTKLRMLQAKALASDAILDDAERARLLSFHRSRLMLKAPKFDELLATGAIKLFANDPGDGAVLFDLERKADIYAIVAQYMDENSSLDDVLRLRRIHSLCRPGQEVRPPASAIAAAVRHMPTDPTNHDFTRLLCGGAMAQRLVTEHKNKHGGSHRFARAAAGADAAALLQQAPLALRDYLVKRGFGQIRDVPPACAAQLLGCRNEMLFGLGLLLLDNILRKPVSRHAYHKMLVLKQIANAVGDDDLATLDGLDRFAIEYCLEKTRFPNDPDTRRHKVGHFLLEAHVDIDREVRAAEPPDAELLRGFQLPLPRMPREFAAAIGKGIRKQIADGRRKRKDRVEPISDGLAEARFLAGSRVAELSHDQKCCAQAMTEAAKLDTSGPVEITFSYLAPIFDDDGRRVPGLQRRHWTLRNTNRINEMLVEVGGTSSRDHRHLPGGDQYDCVFDTEWWLTYDCSDGVDGTTPRDPWLSQAVDALAFYTGRGLPPEMVRKQLGFLKTNKVGRDLAIRLPRGLAWYAGPQAKRARRVLVELGLRPFPITELTHGMLVAIAGTNVMKTSGARTHEFFQIVQDPGRFFRLENLPNEEQRYVFLAVPKGFTESVPFVVTRECAMSIWAMAKFAGDRWHGGGPIPITAADPALREKCGPGRFVANAGDRPLRPNTLSPLVQVLFIGRHELEAYDLRHSFAGYAAGTGVPLEIIAAWLNQKSLDITRYYAKASRKMRDRWWIQFHTSIDLQEHQARALSVQDAEKAAAFDNVGALTSVVGGTCVTLGECPVRFSCIGCRSNAPDPDKADEVQDSMVAAVSLRDVWARHGRVKSVQEQEQVIARHQATLREMDLIRKYRAMRDEVVDPNLRMGDDAASARKLS